MEVVWSVYDRPYDPSRPVGCVDEGGKPLIGGVREPRPARPGPPAKRGSESRRGGVADLFPAFEPLAGRRRVRVTERKPSVDFARSLREWGDQSYPEAERIVRACDHLSAHTPAALYEAFEPAEARRLAERFERHSTPEHGSWLNVAEMELSALARACLDRRIPDLDTLRREVAAWQRERNAAVARVEWQFTTAGARVKLKKLDPTVELQ